MTEPEEFTESDGIKELRSMVLPEKGIPVSFQVGYRQIKSLVSGIRTLMGKKETVPHTWKEFRDNPTGRKKE